MNDTDLLPAHLLSLSISPLEIVLPFNEALEAINLLAKKGYYVLAWEGWLRTADGKIGHAGRHQGTDVFPRKPGQTALDLIQAANEKAIQTIRESQRKWDADPELANAVLYFCLTAEAA